MDTSHKAGKEREQRVDHCEVLSASAIEQFTSVHCGTAERRDQLAYREMRANDVLTKWYIEKYLAQEKARCLDPAPGVTAASEGTACAVKYKLTRLLNHARQLYEQTADVNRLREYVQRGVHWHLGSPN